jgi:hypothetical protein
MYSKIEMMEKWGRSTDQIVASLEESFGELLKERGI